MPSNGLQSLLHFKNRNSGTCAGSSKKTRKRVKVRHDGTCILEQGRRSSSSSRSSTASLLRRIAADVLLRTSILAHPAMCIISSRETIAVSIVCVFINAFNVVYVLRPEIRTVLEDQEWFVYIPDVHNVSKFVSTKTSNYIWMGLAGISIFFDVLIIAGTAQYVPEMVDAGITWHYFDLGADAVVGLASANYTRPRIVTEKKEIVKKPGQSRRSGCVEDPSLCPPVYRARDNATDAAADNTTMLPFTGQSSRRAFAADDDEDTYGVLFQPPTVRQFLHFSYVFCRATCKFETLGALAGYSRRMIRREYIF